MNEYFVYYRDNERVLIPEIISGIKSREDAEEIKRMKDQGSFFEGWIEWNEIIPDDFVPFPDTRHYNYFVTGNVVRIIKPFREEDTPSPSVGKIAIVVGSRASMLSPGSINLVNQDFNTYCLAFLDEGNLEAWYDADKLEFFAVGDPNLVNLWMLKYMHEKPNDELMLVDEIRKIGK